MKHRKDDSTIFMKTLLNEIPFNFDTITTRMGSRVEERRGTAWVADAGVGSLAYSGKLMPPHPLPSIASKTMAAASGRMHAGIFQCHGGSNVNALMNNWKSVFKKWEGALIVPCAIIIQIRNRHVNSILIRSTGPSGKE